MSQSEALASRRAWVDAFPAPMEVIMTCRHILPKVVMTLQSNPEKSLLIFIVWNELVSNAYTWQIIRLFTCLTHVMGIQDSLGLWIVRRKFRIPGTGHRILYPWNLDSGFQSWVGFRIPWAVFRIPKPRISFSTSKNFPASGILILLHGAVSCLIVCSVSGRDLIPWNNHRSSWSADVVDRTWPT